MAQYKETHVQIKGTDEWQKITSGTRVIKNHNVYRFEWCTYQFERWTNLSKEPPFNEENWEGGMRIVSDILTN